MAALRGGGYELDHVFVCATTSRAEAELAEFGLDLTVTGVHPGQGTRNACAFFDDAYLEILRPHDEAELRSPHVEPLRLGERMRWRETGACPFGLAFRRAGGAGVPIAIETWPYAAPFLPGGHVIPIVTPRHGGTEPMVFLSPGALAPARRPEDRRPPLEHRGSRRRLTGVTIRIPSPTPLCSSSRALFSRCGIRLEPATMPHLELEWDHGVAGGRAEFTAAPLSIRW